MTKRMMQAGIESLLLNKDKEPEDIVSDIWQAVKAAKQKEAMDKYRSLHLE